MATRLKPVDVVTIGVGLTGSLAGLELAETGLKVVGLERGGGRDTVPDFQSPAIHDELRFSIRKGMMQDNTKVAVTFRNNSDQTALPLRRWESFLPGQGLGGAFVHWNGQSFRFQVADFTYRTHILERYGQKFLDACGPELTIRDWGVTYDELEAHYDRFEYLCGVSGKAGNIGGQLQPGGNPFEAPRSREYPNPPMKETYFGAIFRKGVESLGYHPYPQPSANLSRPYTNPLGLKLEQCVSAASASATLASTMPRRARRPSSSPSCSRTPTTSCGQTARCCASISTARARRPPASPMSMRRARRLSNPPTSC